MRTATLLVLALAAGCNRPAAPADPGPVVRVKASYPGASATVVADTVAAPIELAVTGAEGAVLLESESRDDGSYTLVVRFKPGTDVNTAQVLVQNRVNIAVPAIPDEVRRLGVSVDKTDPDRFPDLWIAVTGAEPALLGAAAGRTRDELVRVVGVWDARVVGAPTSGVRAWLDPDKLADCGLTADDVATALRTQNLAVAAGQIGAPPGGQPGLSLTTPDGLPDLDALGGTVLKVRDAALVRLRDVAKLELRPSDDAFARANDAPAVLLAVTADDPAAVRKRLAEIDKLPKGVRVEAVADGRGTVVEVRLPGGASAARTREATERAVKAVRALPGSPACLAFSGRETNAATVLVTAGNDGPSRADLRKALADLKDARVRVSDLAAGRPFPIRLALSADDPAKLRAWADAVAQKLAADGLALDSDVAPGPDVPHLSVNVDREKAAKLGIAVADITEVMQTHLGTKGDDLKQLQVSAAGGKMVPLGAVVEFKEGTAPPAVVRVNLKLALCLTAAVPPVKSVAEVVAACRKVAEAEAPKGGTVVDLSATKAP